jgi:hypothetical protein
LPPAAAVFWMMRNGAVAENATVVVMAMPVWALLVTK